ncbi:MAG: hypothetical protein LC105_06070 [Chitinophagales bacterium]|nr:hypothetical protein [Chitinophagales bacterium]
MISERASKLQLIEQYASLTLSKIIDNAYPSVAVLARMHGKDKVDNAMAVIISDLNTSYGGDMDKEAILETVVEIRSGITCNLSLEDLYLICSQLKKSNTFKLKVPAILKAVHQHLDEKTDRIVEINYNKHLAYKHNDDRTSNRPADDPSFKAFQAEYFREQSRKTKK